MKGSLSVLTGAHVADAMRLRTAVCLMMGCSLQDGAAYWGGKLDSAYVC